MAPHGMRQRLVRFSLLVVLSSPGPSVANDDIPIDIFRFSVHGNGAEHVLRLVEKHGVLAHLRCLHDRTLVFGTMTTMKMPGVDCANSSGECVLRAEASEDPPTHAFIYTYNHHNDPRVKATIERVVAAIMAAAKDNSEIGGFDRTCCRTFNRDTNATIP